MSRVLLQDVSPTDTGRESISTSNDTCLSELIGSAYAKGIIPWKDDGAEGP